MNGSEQAYRYPGSRPFQDTPLDRGLFSGRSEEAHELLHLTLAESLVLVFGKSGLGKSSLINAGLLEPLRQRDFFPMVVRVNDPEGGPLQTLYKDVEEAIHRGGIEILTVPGGWLETEYGLCCRGGTMARGELSELCFRRRIPLRLFFKEIEFWRGDVLQDPVLVIDQFEELFTLQSADKRAEFIGELANLVRDRRPYGEAGGAGRQEGRGSSGTELAGPAVKILLSMREDWLGSLEELVPKIPSILSARFRLAPLSKEQAREAIVRPAAIDAEEIGGRTFTYAPEAVEAILDFLSQRRFRGEMVPSDEVAPSQLQLVCRHLEELICAPGHPSTVTLDDLGGREDKAPEVLSGVLEKFYDEQTAKVAGRPRLAAVRRLCEEGLIINGRRASSDGAILRQRFGVRDGELRGLTDCHLLRAIPRLDSVYYELSHDSLVKPVLAARGKRRQRRNRNLSRALLGVLVAVVLFGVSQWQEHRAARARLARQGSLEELGTARAGAPVDFLVEALDATRRTGCLTASGKICDGIRVILREAVDDARETGRFALPEPGSNGDGRPPWPGSRSRGRRAEPALAATLARAAIAAGDDRLADPRDVGGKRFSGFVERHPELRRTAAAKLTAIAVDPGGRRLATAGDDGTLRLWDRRGEPLTRPWMAHPGGVVAVAFDPPGERLLTSGDDRRLGLWDLQGNRADGDPLIEALGDEGLRGLRVNALAWGGDGRSIAIGGDDGVVRVWRSAIGWRAFRQRHSKVVRAVGFDAAGARLASAGADGTLQLWDPASGKRLGDPLFDAVEGNQLIAVAWSPDGSWIATGGSDKQVRLWRIDGGSGVRVIGGHEGHVLALAWSPDGRYLASGGRDSAVRTWDLGDPASPRQLEPIEGYERYVNSVRFSADGALMTASFGGTVRIVAGELADPEVVPLDLRQHELVGIAVSADGSRVATGSSDGTLRLWEWAGAGRFGLSIPPFRGDWQPVEALAFGPAAEKIAAGSADGTLRVWQRDGDLYLPSPLRGHSDRILELDFRGERTLVSRSADGTERLWDLAPIEGLDDDALVESACARLDSLGASELDRETAGRVRDVLRNVCGSQTAI